jgi:hypothetical protein
MLLGIFQRVSIEGHPGGFIMKQILLITLVLCGYGAFAQEANQATETHGSEFFYQPEVGHFEITPSAVTTLQLEKYNDTNSGSKNLTSGVATTPIAAAFEYGITSGLAIGLSLGYQDGHTGYRCDDAVCPSNTVANGLTDPELDLKGVIPMGGGAFHYGGALDVAVEKMKIKATGDTNAGTGGVALAPYVGYDRPLWKGFIGGKLSYRWWLGDRQGTDDSTEAGDTVKFTGGDMIKASAFYEVNFNIMTYGVALNFARTAETHTTVNGGSGGPLRDAVNENTVQFYFPAHFTPKLTLLPVIGFGGGSFTSDSSRQDAEVIFQMGVGCRFIF